MIKLVADTIDAGDIKRLIEWLQTNPQLTKGKITVELEKRFAKWLGTEYAVFVNSGSSANLLMLWTLIELGFLKAGDKIFIPAVSWSTDVAPVIQLGLEPVLVDVNLVDLSINIDHFADLIEAHRAKGLPKVLLLVSILGLVPNMKVIRKLCDENNIILLEDCCEAMGSEYAEQRLGTFGFMSSFSTYFGHHISTIEGGFVATNNERIYNFLLALRSHGWCRDQNEYWQKRHRWDWEIDDFNQLYTFYYAGFNLRPTDLQAYIGLGQLDKLDDIIDKRNKNYKLYLKTLKDYFWKPTTGFSDKERFISSFAYPIIAENPTVRIKMVKELQKNEIEVRPLICGSIGEQPFYIKRYGKKILPNAQKIHTCGFYLPNHCGLTENDIKFICDILNNIEK